MKKICFIVLSFMTLNLISCKDFLEETPTDFVSIGNFYKTESDIISALAGIYDVLGKTSAYGRYFFLEMDMSDEQNYNNNGTVPTAPDLQYFNYQISDIKLEAVWSNLYTGINRANMLIENVDNADIMEDKKEAYKAEAMFLRAYYYFLLTNHFGNVPLRLQSTKSPNEVDFPPSPYSVIYHQIVQDMEYAADKVPDITAYNHGGRVTKSAVWGILARVNLKMAGAPLRDHSRYAEARKWAKKVIDLGYHELHPDYTQVFKNYAQKQYYTKESIWEVEFAYWSGTQNEEGQVGSANGVRNTDRNMGYSYGLQRPMEVYYKRFEQGDLRRDWTISDYTYSGNQQVPLSGTNITIYYNRYGAKFRREYENNPNKSVNTTIINFPLLRYSDVLLMFAEADNQMNRAPSSEAINAVNIVRRRAFGKFLPGAVNIEEFDIPNNLDALTFQTFIQDERSRELGFEALRRFDLIRWGIYYSTMKDLLNYKSSAHVNYRVIPFIPAENLQLRDTLYAIPSDEMMINKLMVQNPGW